MELSGVIVLALVSCVTCSPYGFGVKSAAVAKADANAGSGTFGGALPAVPLSIPSSGGISGSFSKTSSSSFAASSSSSSSSSSSFSYGGTNGVAGTSIPSSPYGSPGAHNAFGASGSIAQAAANANAVAGSSTLTQNAGGLPCTGNDCNNADNTNQQQTDLNDFEVHIGGNPKPSNTLSHDHTSGFDKSGCFYKKCGTNIALAPSGNAASTNPQQPAIHLSTPNIEPACSTHNCNTGSTGANLNNGKPSSYNVPILGGNQGSPYYDNNARPTGPLYDLPSDAPSTSVTTPKIPSYSDGIYSSQLPTNSAGSPSCNGPNCNSLNNPAHPPSHPSCNTPNCDVHISSGPSSQAGYVKPGTVPSLTQTTSFGVSGSGSNSGHNAFSGYSDGSLKPNYNNPTPNAGLLNIVAHPASIEPPKINVVSPSQNIPGYTSGFGSLTGPIDANLGSIKPTTEFGTSDASVLGQNNVIKPSSNVVPSSQNTPSYTGGFGGSPGSFDTHTGSNYQSRPNNENPSSTPSTIPHDTGIAAGSGHVSLDLPKPDSSVHSGQSTPSYGGFEIPAATADIHSGVGSQNKPHIAGGAPVTGLHGSFGVKPESGIGSLTQTSPIYTGGFGGSPGSFDTHTGSNYQFKPNKENPSSTPSTIPHDTGIAAGSGHVSLDLPKPDSSLHSAQNTPSYTGGFGTLTGSIAANFGPVKPTTGFGASGASVHGINNAIKPSSSVGPSIQNIPSYTGGFGGSLGSFDTHTGSNYQSRPNKGNPSSTPSTIPHDTGIAAGSGHVSLDLPKPDSSLHSAQNTPHTGGFGTLTGSIDANFEPVKPTTGFGASGASVHGINNAIKPSSSVEPSIQNVPSYTGGFGGSLGSFDTHTGSNYQSRPNNENPSSTPSTIPHDTGIAAGSGHVSLDLPKPDSSIHSGQSTFSYGGFGTPAASADIHSHNKPHIIGGAPVTGLHESFGIKPASGVGSLTQTSTIYTGGFGGSPGSINTNSKIGTHFESKLTHNKIASGANTALSSADQKGSVTTNYGSGLSYNHDTQKLPHTGISNTGYAGATNALKPGLLKPVDENTKLPTYSGGFGGPSGILKPNEYSVSTNFPTSPIGHTSCASGNCGSSTVHKVEKGKENILSGGASSDASASANAYSGSFGGPPGLFKPFDDGKPTKHEHDGYAGKDTIVDHDKSTSGVNSEYGNTPVVKDEFGGVNKAPHALVNADNAAANANAAAIASSNAFIANQGIGSSGCNSGCSSNYNSATGGSFASNLGSSSGALGGHGSLVGSLASANSIAGAGAGTFGTGRSFASSSASAHSSAGAAVKGGYGKR